METKLAKLEDNLSKINQQPEAVLKLQEALQKLSLGEKAKPPIPTRRIYHFEDPKKILEEVKRTAASSSKR